jgi:metal-responsive CopG/Arc/MetJ family transcriptional regulator
MSATSERTDRRRRHADDPTIAITVNIPRALLARLDDAVIALGGTRSGRIVQAVTVWLSQQSEAGDG